MAMLSFNTTQQHNTSQLDKTLSQKDEPKFFAVITALPSNLPTGPKLAIKFEERGVRKVTTTGKGFSRLVQNLPSSRV